MLLIMSIAIVLLGSAFVILVFAVTVLGQSFARRRPYQLILAIALFRYFISTGALFWAGVWGLNPTICQLWYLLGVIFVAVYLERGTPLFARPTAQSSHYHSELAGDIIVCRFQSLPQQGAGSKPVTV